MYGLSFQEVSGPATLEIGFDKVDGAGGTIAFVFQPANGLDMSACGGACGDYTFDNEEVYTIQDFKNVFRHETGHAIGAPHYETGIMAPHYSYGSPNIPLDALIKEHIRNGYPLVLT